MGTVVLDSCVVIACSDSADVLHDTATAEVTMRLGRGMRAIVPTSVLAESLVGAFRLGDEFAAAYEKFVETLADELPAIDRDIAREAARLRARHKALRLPDALVVATGFVMEADEILTADQRLEKIDDRITVIRPTA